MSDHSESDSDWIIVDKNRETDSETSSVVAVCEPEQWDESLSENKNPIDELQGSGWRNPDEFITDSDIEACTEESEDLNDEQDALARQTSFDLPVEMPHETDAIEAESSQEILKDSQTFVNQDSRTDADIEEVMDIQSDPAQFGVVASQQEQENVYREEENDDELSAVSSPPSSFEAVDFSDAQSNSVGEQSSMAENIPEPPAVDREEKNDDELSVLSSPPSSFETVDFSDVQSNSVSEQSFMAENISESPAGTGDTVVSQQEVLTKDSSCQYHADDEFFVNTYVQTTAACDNELDTDTDGIDDAFSVIEDAFFERRIPNSHLGLHKQFVFALMMLNAGFILGRYSFTTEISSTLPMSYTSKDEIETKEPFSSVENVHSESANLPSSRDSVTRKSRLYSYCNDLMFPTLKKRLEKEFERQSTHIKVLKKDLEVTKNDCSVQMNILSEKLRSKDLDLERLGLRKELDEDQHKAKMNAMTEKEHDSRWRRLERQRLLYEIADCRAQAKRLEFVIQQTAKLHAPQKRLSPLIRSLRKRSQTCAMRDRVQSERRRLRREAKVQNATIKRLERDLARKSLAVEIMYEFMTKQEGFVAQQGQTGTVTCREVTSSHDASVKSPQAPSQVDNESEILNETHCYYAINESASNHLPLIDIAITSVYQAPRKFSVEIENMQRLRAYFASNSTCDQGAVVTQDSYVRVARASNTFRRELRSRKRELDEMKASYVARNRSLTIAKRQKENVKGRLVEAKKELKQLRQEKVELNVRLRNVTEELRKKSSMKYCMQSAFASELARVNNTKLYKVADKMAKKVTQASKKAWLELQRMIGKYSHNDDEKQTRKHTTVKFSVRDYKDRAVRGKKNNRNAPKHHKTQKKSAKYNVDDDRFGQEFDRNSKKKSRHWREKRQRSAEKGQKSAGKGQGSAKKEKSGYRDLVARHLAPVYNQWERVYRDVRSKVSKKSLRDVWDSLLESDEEEGKDMEQPKQGIFDWDWQSYENLTAFLQPILPNGALSYWDDSDSNQQNPGSVEERSGDDISEYKDSKDSEWFDRRSQQRDAIRKQNLDAPLSEEEFDWFLQMFEERERLRQSKDGKYPKSDPDDKEVDWFLKMFEARARLRFRNEDREMNWHEKMMTAREARIMRGKPTDWYTGMVKGREALRRNKEKNWYSVMAEGWEKLRREAFNGDAVCQAPKVTLG